MLSLLKNNKNLLVFFYFLLLLSIGLIVYDDYGISIDEDNTRIKGFVALRYIFDLLALDYSDFLSSYPSMSEWNEKGIGFIFDLPTAFIEYIFNISDSRNYYLLRHLINFIFFYIAIIYFYFLIKNRFNSTMFAVLGVSFLYLSPRIFAESFYNNKDLIFLSLFVIATYYSIKFLDNPSYKNSFLFALTLSLSMGIRITGIILALISILIYIIKILRAEKNRKDLTKYFTFFLLIFPILVIIFYPYLWNDPIKNFIFIFERLGNHPMGTFNFYLGEYISSENLPWHYTLVWIFVTTPIFYIALFISGFFIISRRMFKRLFKIEANESLNDLWRGNNEMKDLIHLFIFILPIFVVIVFHSTLYDGWRHLYFIYPSFLMISLSGLYFIYIKYFKKKFLRLLIINLAFIIHISIWMIMNHPFQYVYFNKFASKNFNKFFVMDFWGLSNNQALEYILEKDSGDILVSRFGDSDLNLNKQFLHIKKRSRTKITSIENSEYVINNFVFWDGRDKKNKNSLENNFEIYHDIKINNVTINRIYKKIDK